MRTSYVLLVINSLAGFAICQTYFEVPSYKFEAAPSRTSCNGTSRGSRYITQCEIPERGSETCCSEYAVNTIDYAPGSFCERFSMRCGFAKAGIDCYLFANSSAAARWMNGDSFLPTPGSYIAGCNASRECGTMGDLPDAATAAPTLAILARILTRVGFIDSGNTSITFDCLSEHVSKAPAPAPVPQSSQLSQAPQLSQAVSRGLTDLANPTTETDIPAGNGLATPTSGLSRGAIAGTAVGVSVFVALTAALVIVIVRWRNGLPNKRKRPGLQSVRWDGPSFQDVELVDITSTDLHEVHGGVASDHSSFLPSPRDGTEGVASVSLHPNPMQEDELRKLENAWKVDKHELCFIIKDGKRHLLGKGGFGEVFLGLWRREKVAIKLVKSHTDEQLWKFLREVAVLRACTHPHVVQFMGACVEGRTTFMIMEYMGGGNLYHKLQTASSGFGWYERGCQVALEVVRGLIFLHSKSIAHLDLKSPNVLLDASGKAKICDVGLGKMCINFAMASVAGSFCWAAPEQLFGKEVSTACDIWSFGTLLHEICAQEAASSRILRELQVPLEAPQDVVDLITCCHHPRPDDRPTAEEVYDTLTKIQVTRDF